MTTSTFPRSKEQKQFADRMMAHIVQGGAPLLLEGAAGLGKTRAYLMVLLACGQPVAVCVPTRALAAQLVASADLRVFRNGQTVEVFTPRRHFEDTAQYQAHKQACQNADLLVCTHQAALIDVLADGGLIGLKNRYAIVFDEADQLPDAAALRFDCAIDPWTFKQLGVKPGPYHRKTVQAALGALPAQALKLDEPAAVRAACRGILDALDAPVWYQTVGLDEEGTLRLHHQLPARALKRLFVHPRLAFVSATLTVKGRFDDFKRALGLSEVSAWSGVVEPAKHGELTIAHEDWDKGADDHLAKVAAHVAGLTGYVLVIATSYADSALLGAMLPDATVRSEDPATGDMETTGAAAERMDLAKGHILIAAGAWAGLDTPIRWGHVVMPKVPYQAPTVLDDHEVSRYVDSRNTAIRRFRQGLARGLRSPEAVCCLHLLDSRFMRPEFEKALPARFLTAYQKRFSTVEVRTRQAAFRQLMFEKFDGRCAISGVAEPSVLEAAHLGSPGGWRTNHQHGILLRIDLHRLMDKGLLSIENGVVRVTGDYGKEFDGKRI